MLLGLIAVAGCSRDGDAVMIITDWTEPECAALEREARERGGPPRIGWIRVPPGADPTLALDRPVAVDVVLGGRACSYHRLAATGRLAPLGDGRATLGLITRAPPADRPAPGDPRRDPIRLAWAETQLGRDDWPSAYAQLVGAAADALTIGRGPGSAHATEEGVGLVAGGRHPDLARAFLRGLAGRARFRWPPADPRRRPGAVGLLADLLGATLIDAQPELRAARAALVRAGEPRTLRAWMTAPPPWPPASILKLRSSRDGKALVGALAAEIAPDPRAQTWLLASWSDAERPIDGAVLDGLADAAGGRLIAEPRFRAWLRAEWVAWARQRYRRVARAARGEWP